MEIPDYSPYAKQYATSRPGYPRGLFDYLASLVNECNAAWDCATGSGQAAVELARHFKKVFATDVSAEQIKFAVRHPRIEYKVSKVEQSGLETRSINLVTVATALHWFDLDVFYKEVKRVIRPEGLLAIWAYHVGHPEPPFDRVLGYFYYEIVAPYFAPGARLVDQKYSTITLPGDPVEVPEFYVQVIWDLQQMLTFIENWSGTKKYIEEHGEDPILSIKDELVQLWERPENKKQVRWPLYIRISRL